MSNFADYTTDTGQEFTGNISYEGRIGPIGPQGPKGEKGDSTYDLAVQNGYIGTEEQWVNEHLSPEGYYNKDTIDSFLNTFIDGIAIDKLYDSVSKTTYYITEIPFQDFNGVQNKWKLGVGQDNNETLNSRESTIEFAKRKNASICINGGLFQMSNGTNKPWGVLIQDGVILQDEIASLSFGSILGIKEDGNFQVFDKETSAQQILDAGCVNALFGYKSLIENGVAISDTSVDVAPRQVICRKSNNNYLIFTCDGRTIDDLGMTRNDVQRILLQLDVVFAYELDGGGSTSTVVELQKVNKNIDSHYIDRTVQNFLYMAKNISRQDIEKLYAKLSNLRQDFNENLTKLKNIWSGYLKLFANDATPGIEFFPSGETEERAAKIYANYEEFSIMNRNEKGGAWSKLFSVKHDSITHKGIPLGKFMNYCTNSPAETDLNNITNAGFYLATNASTNTPKPGNFIILHINTSSALNNKQQYAFPVSETNGYIYSRRKVAGQSSWTAWEPINIFSSATVNRPTNSIANGTMFFDTTLGKPIWWNGTDWVDSTGTAT